VCDRKKSKFVMNSCKLTIKHTNGNLTCDMCRLYFLKMTTCDVENLWFRPVGSSGHILRKM
jgi:hypothetical protein